MTKVNATEYELISDIFSPFSATTELDKKIYLNKDESVIAEILKNKFDNNEQLLKKFILENSISVKTANVNAELHSDIFFNIEIDDNVDEDELDEYIENNFRKENCDVNDYYLSSIKTEIKEKYIMKKFDYIF